MLNVTGTADNIVQFLEHYRNYIHEAKINASVVPLDTGRRRYRRRKRARGCTLPGFRTAPELIPDPILAYPEDEMAEALLSVIARHPKPDEYGMTEILASDPADLTRAQYMPSLARGGDALGMDVALLKRALNWLVKTGWLEPAGQTSKVRLYRLGAHSRADQRFKELVNRETASIE